MWIDDIIGDIGDIKDGMIDDLIDYIMYDIIDDPTYYFIDEHNDDMTIYDDI